jgi:hypothetical protein
VAVVSESPRLKTRHVDHTLRLPLVRPPDPLATRSPVFVDTTGRRAHRLRRWGLVVAVPAAAYLVAVASSLLGGPSLPSALLLIDEPGHGSTSQDNSAPMTGSDRASAPAVSPDVRTGSVTPPDDAASGRTASGQPDGEVSRSPSGQTGSSTSSGRSGNAAADRREARGRSMQAGQKSAGQPTTGQATTGQRKGDSSSHVGGGRLRDERLPTTSRLRSADSG